MNKILTLNDSIDFHEYGNKAKWLGWLNQNKFSVPESIFLPRTLDLSDKNLTNEIHATIQPFLDGAKYKVAIRSSSSAEDTGKESKAGHFTSELGFFTFEEVLNKIEIVRNSAKVSEKNSTIGVIIQEKIDPIYSGIAFSSSPITGNKSIGLITYVTGSNEQLTSGNVAGTTIELKYNEEEVQFEKTELKSEKIKEIALILKKLEAELKRPVDIEWALNENYDLILLQCRFITGLFFGNKIVFPINMENEKYIPNYVKNDDKIKIRLLADKYKVRASIAHLFLIENTTDYPNIPKKIQIEKSEYCLAYSTVILYPSTHDGKIQRLFATVELNDKHFISYCHRYGVRAIENANSVNASLYKLVDLVKNEYWTTVIILQEFYESDYSGIVKKLHDGYLVEIVKGQFIAKGILDPTSYILDFNLNIIQKNEIEQEMEVNINDGKTEEKYYDTPILLSFNEDNVKTIVKEFKPLLDNRDSIIEFALLKNNEEKVIPYLYDLVEDESNSNLSYNDIHSGILSTGEIEGKLVGLKEYDSLNENLNLHFHNETTKISSDQENIVFYCKMPSISLLKIFNSYDKEKIGFIFEKGSILAHFSIVLREKKIPAIILNSELQIDEGIMVKIDAITPNLTPQQRISSE